MKGSKYSQKFIPVVIFSTIALLSGWIGLFIDQLLPDQGPGETLGMGLWLVIPCLSGIIIRLISRDWNGFGIRFHIKQNLGWYLFAIILFPAVTLGYTLVAYLFGIVTIRTISWNSLSRILGPMLIGLLIKNIFEDFAWQGFLTPKIVATKVSDLTVYLVVGLVWAFWHAPYYLFFLPESIYENAQQRLLDTFLYSPLVITIWAVVFVEITRITRSVWPAVIMHTIEDLVPNVLIFEQRIIQFQGIGDLLFNPLRGIFPLITFLLFGLWLRKKRIGLLSHQRHQGI